MFFARKIYINNKPLILTNSTNWVIDNDIKAKGYLSLNGAFSRNLRLALLHINNPRTLGAIIEDISEDSLKSMIEERFELVQAGGGVVLNEDGDVLMIFRRGKWDLPKGKTDPGEDIQESAVREVQEETGVTNLDVIKHLDNTYHIYSQGNTECLKCTSWYLMRGTSKDSLQAQAEENILKVEWVNSQKLPTLMNRTYDAIQEILRKADFNV